MGYDLYSALCRGYIDTAALPSFVSAAVLTKNISLFVSYLVLGGGVLLAALLLRIALKLWQADSIEGKKSASRASSIKDAIRGRARTHEDWIPDARIKGGMVYNKKAKRLEVSGRLSDGVSTVCSVEPNYSDFPYAGWIPSVNGRLSFRHIGKSRRPSEAIYANVTVPTKRFILAFQERRLSDQLFQFISHIFYRIEDRFYFLIAAETTKSADLTNEIKGTVHIYKSEWDSGLRLCLPY